MDWDEKTRRLVTERVLNVPVFRFFTPLEASQLKALCDRLMPQEDRPEKDRIPIAPWIDDRLSRAEGWGYQYEGMPDDGTAYHLGLKAINLCAQSQFGKLWIDLDPSQQDELIRGLQRGSLPGECWQDLPPLRFFELLMSDVITSYYSYPAAQAEIGFNGPSSPRGHIRLDLGFHDPWEAQEERPLSSVEIVRKSYRPGEAATGGATH
jgi:hypothetical protein